MKSRSRKKRRRASSGTVRGYWFALRKRFPETLPVCIFTLGLTIVYALFQTNVGTAHRQRTQLYVFLVIFISIGWEQWQLARRQKRRSLYPRLVPARAQTPPYSPKAAS